MHKATHIPRHHLLSKCNSALNPCSARGQIATVLLSNLLPRIPSYDKSISVNVIYDLTLLHSSLATHCQFELFSLFSNMSPKLGSGIQAQSTAQLAGQTS